MKKLSPEDHDRLAHAWELRWERLRRRSSALLADVPPRIVDEVLSSNLDPDAPPLPELLDHLRNGQHLVVLSGPPGTGKTTAAVVALQSALSPGKFVTAPDYCRWCQTWSTAPLAASARQTHGVLVLDDLGEEPGGNEEDLSKLLTARYNVASSCTTIVTTNLQPKHLARYGDRIVSRLRDHRYCGIIICREVLRPGGTR